MVNLLQKKGLILKSIDHHLKKNLKKKKTQILESIFKILMKMPSIKSNGLLNTDL
jgi:hypothetical protein